MNENQFNLTTYFLDRQVQGGRENSPALFQEETVYTYGAIASLTNKVGNALRELGVSSGDRILLALNDCVEFVATWFAIIKIGAVVAEVYPFLRAKDFKYYLTYSQAKVIIADRSSLDNIRSAAAGSSDLAWIVVVDGNDRLRRNEVSFDQLIRNASPILAPAATHGDDIALWKFTTGSTGAPKAAVHTHQNPLASFKGFAQGVLHLEAADRILAVPKLFFGYARDLVTLFTFGVGGSGIIYPDRPTPARIFQQIEKHKPTILVNVPTMMNAMIKEPGVNEIDMSSLRLNTSAGEALPEAVHQSWMETFGVETINGIGSSEMYHIYIAARPGEKTPLGSLGKLVPGYQATIVDLNGREVKIGETGELWIQGESAAVGYWLEPEKSNQTFANHNKVRTGDLCRRDADGYFWFEGRVDQLLKVGGIWISPLEIEGTLIKHPAVRECAVVGIPVDGLIRSCAFVVLSTSAAAGPELIQHLQEFVKNELSPHKFPREIQFVTHLPKTASGKLDRKGLRQNYAA